MMLPARLRLSTERGVEAPLEEAEYDDDDDDVEDLSNLLNRSLGAPTLLNTTKSQDKRAQLFSVVQLILLSERNSG